MFTSWRPTFIVVVSPSMRRFGATIVVLACVLGAIALGRSSAPAAVRTASATCVGAIDSPHAREPRQLTIGTDNPGLSAVFAGGSPKGSKWKINDPSTGKGYESAVAYAVAAYLGFARGDVQWAYTPFNKAFAPGPKSFDFDINQISYTAARAKVVAFSKSYYDVNQRSSPSRAADLERAFGRRIAALQARCAARHDELPVHRLQDQAVQPAGGLPEERRGGSRR